MKRFIEEKLKAWKDSKARKPLIVRGARQVGKTFTIKEFGKSSFPSLVIVDFERSRAVHSIFKDDLDPYKMVRELEVFSGQKIIPGETLLFFDEIQACKRALMMLRYIYEEIPDLHVIAAGSLLEFAINSLSFPVGRVTFEWMRPMSFREFLLAGGKEILVSNLPSVFRPEPISEILHHKILEELRSYLIVGGMPEAVKRYLESGSLKIVKEVHDDIVNSYIDSLVKYNKRTNIESLEHLMRSVPSNVGSQIKYTNLDPDRRIEVTKTSLNILENAFLANRIRATDVAGLPLGANESAKVFKAIFLDVGLMQNICGLDPMETINAADLTSVYRGAVAEQFVGQELLASGGSENYRLYYWSRMKKGSTAEVDFVISRSAKIYPVEVKSGSYGRIRSMHQLLNEYPQIEKGFVLSSDIHKSQSLKKLIFMPLYSDLR
ncbi:MAG: ATP-binding protein [Actinobacteria bacterium]|nr:ATP-binding protein [Actinomycetota bacterium]